ncbi:MAG: hypothetical protein QM820_05295 [Minicystis sp.]
MEAPAATLVDGVPSPEKPLAAGDDAASAASRNDSPTPEAAPAPEAAKPEALVAAAPAPSPSPSASPSPAPSPAPSPSQPTREADHPAEKPQRQRTSEALEKVEKLLGNIEGRLGALARMSADRQRLHMLVCICRARAVEEQMPGVRDVEHAVARVARRLTEIGKMFWPGSVRALQLSARPADVRREMHATWAAEPTNWIEATQLAERLLDDHMAKSNDAGLDEDGWADGAARTPKPSDPDALFEEVDAELKAILIPPGEVPNGRLAELTPTELEALINAARRLRWLRGAAKDELGWGIAMGRLRRAVPGLGDRASRVRDVLDHRHKPSVPWAKLLGEREADGPDSTVVESPAKLLADLPAAGENKEALMAWLIRAFDVLNTPDLVAQLQPPHRDLLASLGEEELNHSDRRVRRRLRDLVKRMAEAPTPPAKPVTKEPEEDAAPDEPMAAPALDALSARVRAQTKGSRALFVSNREDPELGTRLSELLGISITWCDGSLRRVQAQCERIQRGSYDLVLSATGFQVHGVDSALARASSAAGIPYVRVNRGRPVACVQAIAREFGLTSQIGMSPVQAKVIRSTSRLRALFPRALAREHEAWSAAVSAAVRRRLAGIREGPARGRRSAGEDAGAPGDLLCSNVIHRRRRRSTGRGGFDQLRRR